MCSWTFLDQYWIVDWRKKRVEIFNLDYDENGEPQYYSWETITEDNKEDLKITFDKLFAEVDSRW